MKETMELPVAAALNSSSTEWQTAGLGLRFTKWMMERRCTRKIVEMRLDDSAIHVPRLDDDFQTSVNASE